MLKSEPEKEQARGVRYDAAIMDWEAVVPNDRQTDPGVVRHKPGAPCDHARLDHVIATDG